MYWTGSAPLGTQLQRTWRDKGVALVLAACCAAGANGGAFAKGTAAETAQLQGVSLTALPTEAQATHRLILNGGPFAHSKDGIVFGNRERLLPQRQRGFYREYTVATPGASNRGARRVVCGGQPAARPNVCYYTDDHYASFRRIVP